MKLPYSGSPNKAGCLELISRYGCGQLGGDDGCECSHFSVCGFTIDISCYKSEHCIRVYSHHIYSQPEDEIEIAALILEHLGQRAKGYKVRYCEYKHDHVNGRWEGKAWMQEYSCCYCGASRPDQNAYLCAKCLKNKDAVSRYPFGLESGVRKCPECQRTRVERDLLGLSEMERKPLLVGMENIGFTIAGALPEQKGESIFRCLNCGHHWREAKTTA